jgi:hypothetical protein
MITRLFRKCERLPPLRGQPRHGVAVVLVLGLISIALALAYSLLRAESTVVQIQANSGLRSSAQLAAEAGIAAGLQRMSLSSWTGVNTTFSGALSAQDSFSVTFTSGDASLATSDPNQPYRVTLLSTGLSINAQQTTQQATYRVRAVVQLSPRQLGPQPASWSAMQNYTVYQTGNGQNSLDVPAQLAGPVFMPGNLSLGNGYSWSTAAMQRYMSDANLLRLAGQPDWRPISGPVSLPGSGSSAAVQLLTNQLGVTVSTIPSSTSVSLPLPNNLTTYQIYPGGPAYKVGKIVASPQNLTLAPDPINNPLGIFFNSGNINVGNNVNITGTLISGGTVNLNGTNVTFQPLSLPPLSGSTTAIRLPVVVARQNVAGGSTLGVTIQGIVLAGGSFSIATGSQQCSLAISGHLFAGSVSIAPRTEWGWSSFIWNFWYNTFISQLGNSWQTRINYFPTWLSGIGLAPNPILTVTSDPTVLVNQWQDLTAGPVYIVNPADTGLRWILWSWAENV